MKRRARCLLLVSAVLAAVSAFGCAPTIGWVISVFNPPQKKKALFKPPKNKKVFVFVDDMRNPVGYEPIKRELTERLNKHLLAHKVAGSAVSYDELLDLTGATDDFNELSIGAVGRKLGADIVLYVQLDRFSLKDEQASELWFGRLETTVWMVDTTAGRIWPKDLPQFQGHVVEPVKIRPKGNQPFSYGRQLATQLAEQMADNISKLFYDHKVGQDSAADW